MISITKQQLDLLIALQENEREEARLNEELKGMPEKKAQMEASLEAFEQDIQTRQERVSAFKKDYRAYDNELELNQSRIKKREVQLHSVKTNKEYQSLLKEIDDIRASNSRLEDASLQCLDDMDSAEKELKEKTREYENRRKQIEQEKQELDKAALDLEERIRQLKFESEAIIEKLDPDLVKKYRQTRDRGGGVGLVQVENAVCKGCHLNIPPQMYNELQRGNELKMCPHCHRLIFVL
ncbi:MAG: zinc ribbon domain-containing protein [Desulfobacterales bacterium]